MSVMSPSPCHSAAFFALLLFVPASSSSQGHASLKVATYNMWNIMFNWDVRKYHIAAMIQEANVDAVAFQEVRADKNGKRNQLLDLKKLLPAYRWHVYHAVQEATPSKDASAGWEMEGLGILSQHSITDSRPQQLARHSPRDKNQRSVLHASLQLASGHNMSISVVHLSYDRWQQCVNVAEIMKYIREKRPENSVILGDFNTYMEYPWPLEGLLYGYFSSKNRCPRYATQKNPTREVDLMPYVDAWDEAHPNKNGFTFSNMPQPGLQSRPDRVIFSSKAWKVHSCQVMGLGTNYAKKYSRHVTWTRLVNVLQAAENAFYETPNPKGCLHDCGPHGSCRCSICVSGGDKNRCEIPNCHECSPGIYRNFLLVKVILCVLIGQFVLSVTLLLQQVLRTRRIKSLRVRYPLKTYNICSLSNCCTATLCSQMPGPRPKIIQSLQLIWPLLYLRPLYQLFVCCVCCILLIILCLHFFDEPLKIVNAVLPEELNPSDHLMVIAEADIH